MSFDTKNGPVYEPINPELKSMYQVLKKNAPVLDGSRVFEELVDVYQTLDFDLREEMNDDKTFKSA